ncbi:MAG TPA: hypothetical protein VKM93_29090 [Terriglobia bacterium]|nr:hypothetical protein [Terriglobia bacterium]
MASIGFVRTLLSFSTVRPDASASGFPRTPAAAFAAIRSKVSLMMTFNSAAAFATLLGFHQPLMRGSF